MSKPTPAPMTPEREEEIKRLVERADDSSADVAELLIELDRRGQEIVDWKRLAELWKSLYDPLRPRTGPMPELAEIHKLEARLK